MVILGYVINMSIRLDYLPKHEDIKIYQDDEMFCINTDTMVLGEFIEIKKTDIVLDIGTNTGALMLYANMYQPKKIVGIDINDKALNIAKQNMKLNNIQNYELICIDGNNFKYNEEFDVIIFNPPYFKKPQKDLAINKYLALAKYEDKFTLESMINTVNRNLRNGGTFYYLFQTSRLNEVIKVLNNKKLVVKKLKFVYDINKDNSTLVLIKAVKGANEGLIVEKPIIIDRHK